MVILCSLTAVNAIDITNNTNDNSLTELNNENPSQTVSTYSASADSTSENYAAKTINKNDNSKSLKADSDKGTFEQLQKLIDDADEDSTIYLDKDYANSKNTFFKTSVNVKKTITIDGQGHTLDVNRKNRVFEISADNVVLRNMTLINGEKSSFTHGNLIYWGGKDGLIENCVLKQSYLYGDSTRTYGGGIYADGEHLTIRNCEFNALRGRYGSAIYLNSKNNVIDNCSFTYNYYYNERYTPPTEPHDIPKVVPAKYTNTIGGGAIYVDGSGNTIKNSYFAYNLAQEGGAIYINKRNNVIDSNIFYNNRASKNGGAIYVNAKFNNINNNIFYKNNINDNIYGIGTRNDIYSSVGMFADKNWGGDFTSPWLWISSCNITSLISGKKLNNSAFEAGGGRPKAFGVEIPRKLLIGFYYEGKMYEYNFARFWNLVKIDFDFKEGEEVHTWTVNTSNKDSYMELVLYCKRDEMLLINYEAPTGLKLHNRLWNGGTGYGEIKLYKKDGTLIDHVKIENTGCEYGEYC